MPSLPPSTQSVPPLLSISTFFSPAQTKRPRSNLPLLHPSRQLSPLQIPVLPSLANKLRTLSQSPRSRRLGEIKSSDPLVSLYSYWFPSRSFRFSASSSRCADASRFIVFFSSSSFHQVPHQPRTSRHQTRSRLNSVRSSLFPPFPSPSINSHPLFISLSLPLPFVASSILIKVASLCFGRQPDFELSAPGQVEMDLRIQDAVEEVKRTGTRKTKGRKVDPWPEHETTLAAKL